MLYKDCGGSSAPLINYVNIVNTEPGNRGPGQHRGWSQHMIYKLFRFSETFISEFYLDLIFKPVEMFGRFKRYHPHDTKSQIGTVLTNYLSHFLVY